MEKNRIAFLGIIITASALLVNIYRFLGKTDNVITHIGGIDNPTVPDSVESVSKYPSKWTSTMNVISISPRDNQLYLTLSSVHRMMRLLWLRGRLIDRNFFDGIFSQSSAEMLSAMREIGNQRESDLETISTEIWRKIWDRQNPENCDEARLLVYDINTWKCGFGCTMHVTLQHFLIAFYGNRTFVLRSNGWAYDANGWEHFLLPLGKCDYNGTLDSLPVLSNKNSNARILRSVNLRLANKYDWKVPRNILERLKKIHDDPFAWWIGQFVNYMLRFQPWFMKVLAERSREIHFTESVVGLHVRWGDKIGTNSIKHPVKEYMNFASIWYERPENKNVNKTVYVATEQSEAWNNLENEFHNFSFIGSGYVSRDRELDYKKRARYAKRKNELVAILSDIHFLSKCPYVVCTYSSNICRMLHELAAIHRRVPMDAIQSLDEKFYRFIYLPKCRVIEDHNADGDKNSTDVKIGDTFVPLKESFQPKLDGHIHGRNTRTGLTGRVPEYKLEVIVTSLNFDI